MVSRVGTSATTTAVGPQDVLLRPVVIDGWARDARMVEEIFQIMEGMEPP